MKFKLIKMAVISLLFIDIVNATQVYNKNGNTLDLYSKFIDLHYLSEGKYDNNHSISLGFKGEKKITHQLTGYGQWEYTIKNDNNEFNSAKVSLAFVGLCLNRLGSFEYGQNYAIAYDVIGFTNIVPGYSSGTWIQISNIMAKNTTGSFITYHNKNLFGLISGLNIAVQHKIKNYHHDILIPNITDWSILSSYKFNGFSIAATYANSSFADPRIDLSRIFNDKYKSPVFWIAGIKYDTKKIYLATTYAEISNITDFDNLYYVNKAQNLEATMQYQFDFGLHPSIVYMQSKGKCFRSYCNQNIAKYIAIGTSYFFKKNISTYINYKINILDSNNFIKAAKMSNKNTIAVGLIYQF